MIIERGGDVSEEKVKASEQNEDIEKEIKEDDKASSVENEKSVEETDDSSKALDELQKKYGDILPVIDNLNRALEIEVDNDASQQLKKGIEMVARDMEKALKNNNVTKIDSLGKVFDPTLHQAVKTVPVEEGQEPETIVQVFQDGYMLKDRVLRPAMVVVAQ